MSKMDATIRVSEGVTAIKLNAGNDTNGNPRRVFVVFRSDSSILCAIDEGYKGISTLFNQFPQFKTHFVPEIATTPKEYRFFLSNYQF